MTILYYFNGKNILNDKNYFHLDIPPLESKNNDKFKKKTKRYPKAISVVYISSVKKKKYFKISKQGSLRLRDLSMVLSCGI